MLALRAKQRPAPDVAHRLLASVFGPSAVRTGGTVFTQFEARGVMRGLPVRVVLSMQRSRTGTAPYTTIHVEDDLPVVVYTGGAAWPYESWEAFSPFPFERLASMAAVGAPRALLSRITHGPIGARLATSGVIRLTVGSEAMRDGCATRGVHFDVEGWPMDEATLRFVIDTVLEVAFAARHEAGRSSEIAAYQSLRATSRAKGLKVAAAIGATLFAVMSLAGFALIHVM